MNNANKRYTLPTLRQYCNGATYVSFNDMISVHLHESSDKQEIHVTLDNPDRRNKQFNMARPWQRIIYLLQTEDVTGYGTQFRSVPKFANNGMNVSLTWSLIGIISSCKQLWSIIDNKQTSFSWSGWEGWVLTSIQHFCFQNNVIRKDKCSPFKKTTTKKDVCNVVNKFIPNQLNEESR